MKILGLNGKPLTLDGMVLSSPEKMQAKTVDLSMASGNQVITPDEGYSLSEVTVTKPATLTPENIKKDVDIGGVVGTMASDPSGTGAPIDVRLDAVTVDRYRFIEEESKATLDLSGLITGNHFICYFYAPGRLKDTGAGVYFLIMLYRISDSIPTDSAFGDGIVQSNRSSDANATSILAYLESDSDHVYDISDGLANMADSNGTRLANCEFDAAEIGAPSSYVVSWN